MDLELLGLSGYEEKAYLALVKLGSSSSSEISRESKVPYGRIYPTLQSLESKGLVVVIPDKTKKFQASDPQNLLNLLKKKKTEITNIEENLKNLKEIYKSNPKEAVTIVKGKNNFYKVVKEMPLAKKSEYNIKYTSETKSEWIRQINEYKKKKIKFKILTRYDEETKKNVDKWLKYTKKIKEIPNEGVSVAIIDEVFMFINIINANTTIMIKDAATIKLFKELFESYYRHKENLPKTLQINSTPTTP